MAVSTVFSGKIRTVKCIGDNVLLRRMRETESEGEVLMQDMWTSSCHSAMQLFAPGQWILRLAFGIAEEVSEFANYQPRESGAIAFG